MSAKSVSVISLLAAVAACSPAGPQWTGTITDSAGVQIVTNTAQGLWPDGSGWTVEEVVRIGTIEGEPEYQFGEIGWLAPGSDGRIYVLDAQGQHVKVFSAAGEYLRTIGGPGNGPGEMGPVTAAQSSVILGPGDTVMVPDNANQRVNRWTSEGVSAGSFPIDFQAGLPLAWAAAPNGAIAEQVRPVSFTGGEDAPANPHDLVILLNTDGTVTDTVISFPSGETITFTGGVPEWTIFTPETVWSLTETGDVILGTSDEYRLRKYDPSGTLTRIITMPWEPRLVSERDKQAVRDFFTKLLSEQPGIPPVIVQRLVDNNVHFGEYLPAFGRTVMGPNGTIWVQLVRAAADMTEEQLDAANFLEDIGAPDWDVLDREGRYLGVVTMPDRFTPRVIVDQNIYGVWRDDLDVQYAVVLRIVGALVD